MKWKVENALNRDVERQHLNKILKEIEASVQGLGTPPSVQEVTRIVERVVRAESPDALTSVSVVLAGDVSGSGSTNANGRININAVIDPSKLGIQEAPWDSNRYWRINGTWERVSDAVSGIQDITEPGIVIYRGGSPAYTSAMLEGTEGEIDVTNGDGQDLETGTIGVGLADVEVVEGGTLKTTSFDSKGRRIEEGEADTDDLPEGVGNLYFSDERAQEAVAGILEDSEHISFVYDDEEPSIRAILSNSNLESIANVFASDGDILEWQESDNEWEVTKSPRLLYLDGGNF